MGKIHKIFQSVARDEVREHAVSDQHVCSYPFIDQPVSDPLVTPAILFHGGVPQFRFTIGLVLTSVKVEQGKVRCIWQLTVSPDLDWIRHVIDAPTKDGRPSVMQMIKDAPDLLSTVPLIRACGIFCTITHRGSNDPGWYASWDYLHGAQKIIDDYYLRMWPLVRWVTKTFAPIETPKNVWRSEPEVIEATKQLKIAGLSLLNRLEAQPKITKQLVLGGHGLMKRNDDGTLYLEDGGAMEGARISMERAHERANLTLCGIETLSDTALEAMPDRAVIPSISQVSVPIELPSHREVAPVLVSNPPISAPPVLRRSAPDKSTHPPPPPSGMGDTFVPSRLRGKKTPNLARRVTPSGRDKKKK